MEKPDGNIAGTSDASPMDRPAIQLFKDLDRNIKNWNYL